MSRMSAYLRQTAQYEAVKYDAEGNPVLDEYGKPTYETAVTVKCRKEKYCVKAATGYGQFLNYSSTYYLDEKIKPRVDDKLDGHLIQDVNEYVDGIGTLVGYEVIV